MTITEFVIGSADRRNIVLLDSVRITLQGDGRGSSCEFSVRARDVGTAHVGLAVVGSFLVGDGLDLLQPVQVKSGANTIFGGEIAMIRHVHRSGERFYEITARDWQGLLDNRTTGLAVYSNMYDGDIIRELVSRFAPGVTVGRADNIILIERIDLSSLQVTEAIRRVAQLAQAEWNLDGTKALFYFDPDTVGAPFGLSDQPDDVELFPLLSSSELEADASELANDVTVANKAAVTTTTQTFTAAASGDDGDVKRDGTTWPPTGAFTVDSTSASARAERTRLNTTTVTGTFGVASGPNSIQRTGLRWPPTNETMGTSNTCEQSAYLQGFIDGQPVYQYVQRTVSYNMDTSTIPANAVIRSATLRVNISFVWGGATDMWFDGWNLRFNPPADITIAHTAVPGGLTPVTFSLEGFPQGTVNTVTINSVQLDVTYETTAVSYTSRVGLFSWDTSSIPDGAQVLSATAGLTVSDVQKTTADSPVLRHEAYAGSNWPIDSADWTATAAGASVALSGITAGQRLRLPVSPGAVSLTGRTGIRVHVDTGGVAPTGTNYVAFSTADAASNKPTLDVEYADLTGYFSARATDDASIAQYGTRAISVIDSRITSQSEAQLRAQLLIAQRAQPAYRLRAAWIKDGAGRGGTVFVKLVRFGFERPMIVRTLTLSWVTPSVTRYEGDLGEYRRDLVDLLRKLSQGIRE